ncbi:MAG: hypothetical protein J2P37_21890, partial [Ktedonobacteraceae bacterium]|nr:hypothetical protein [Ktedonobacteraceae bacterium]
LNDIKAFLGPYVGSVVERGASLPTHPNSILYTTPLNHLVRPLEIIHALLPWLFIASLATAILTALLPQPRHRPVQTHETSWGKEAEGASGQPQGPRPASPHPLPLQIRNTFPSRCRGSALDEPVHHSGTPSPVRDWLLDLWGTSHSQALLLLVMWEGIIPLLMVRHAIPVYLHYYTFLLPGQFILIGIFLQRVTELVRGHLPRFTLPANIIVAASAALLIGAQTVSSTQTLIDTVKGNFNAQAIDLHFYNLAGLQTALDKADRLAQTRHIHRIYIATSYSNDAALRYLAQQLKTPVTLFDGSHCLILPASSAGPVVFLETPYLRMVEPTITHYATATLVDSPWRPGGDPFMLYILTASNTPAPQSTPGSELRPLDQHASLYSADTPRERWLVTRWQILQDAPPLPETTYIHTLDTKLEGTKPLDEISCAATRHWSGDQLFALQRLQPGTTLPSFITVQPTSHTSHMQLQHLGPLTFSIFNWIDTPTRYDRPLKMLTLSVLYETASPLIADSYTSRSFGTVS